MVSGTRAGDRAIKSYFSIVGCHRRHQRLTRILGKLIRVYFSSLARQNTQIALIRFDCCSWSPMGAGFLRLIFKILYTNISESISRLERELKSGRRSSSGGLHLASRRKPLRE